jgi:hypothetical protein
MIRQFPVGLGGGSSLSPYVNLDPTDFTMDLTDTGSDFGSAFSGLASSVDFNPDTQGTVWAHFNFKDSGFGADFPIAFDLHWVANGSIGSTLAARMTLKIWAVDTEDTPTSGAPTDSTTTNISIDDTKTGMKMMSADFASIAAVDIPATCESIFISLTREAANGADTYTGTFQIINVVARQ